VQFILDDPEPLLYHNEPIYRNGQLNGVTTSAMYGHTLGAAVAMGYVTHDQGVTDEFVEQGRYTIATPSGLHSARASLVPLYDPKSKRVRQ
jgi:4-methylaminobutanoate oxidase (formaldehyde-forming)